MVQRVVRLKLLRVLLIFLGLLLVIINNNHLWTLVKEREAINFIFVRQLRSS